MATNTKFFHSGMTGAPVLSGTAGAMIAVLDACLVDGFGLKSVDTLVVSGAVATANISTGHSAMVGSVVLVSGATPSGLNGEKRVTAISTNTVVFDATGISGQTATGTITLKIAPLGWAKPFSGTNLAAYKPTDVTATGMYMRVDDTGATNSRVVGYEAMTGISTGTGPFPTAAFLSGGVYWPKSYQANSTARPWYLIGDGRLFYLAVASGSFSTQAYISSFGDFSPKKSGDPYACVLSSGNVDRTNTISAYDSVAVSDRQLNANFQNYLPRGVFGVGSAVACNFVGGLNCYVSAYSGHYSYVSQSNIGGVSAGNFPNPGSNSLLLTEVFLIGGGGVRGAMPGIYHCPQHAGPSFVSLDVVDGSGSFAGKKMLAIRAGDTSSNTYGVVFFDYLSDWVR